MAYNSHHSASWSDGIAGNNSIDGSGSTDSIGWADIETSLDASSLSGSLYGSGSLARTADDTATTALDSLAHPGFGLVQAGVSPFRGLDPTGEFASLVKRNQDVLANLEPEAPAPLPEPKIGKASKVNSSLLNLLGNLGKREASVTVADAAKPVELKAEPESQAKVAIGLEIPVDTDVHQPGSEGKAKVRSAESVAEQVGIDNITVLERPAHAERRVAQFEPEVAPTAAEKLPEVSPIENPYKYVGDQHEAIKAKFDSGNVKYGRTTLLPDGRVVQVQTASDNTTLTETTGEQGANSMVVHDRYRRPVTEQRTDSDGTWSFSNLSYNDTNGIKPFCSEKLTVNSDGSVVKLRFSSMGQIESRQTFV
ncbi:MAG: hypothetical protein SGJ27_04865 [Candidatus Melainabacteria bacterium]|nr:hypothetical protein [Candidatus Melainabacteria bacterium]